MRSEWDRFGVFADLIADELERRDSMEKQIEKLKQERDYWRELAEPGWKERERQAALDGEIRLLREQG